MSSFVSIPFITTDFMDAVLDGDDKVSPGSFDSPNLSASRLFTTFPDLSPESLEDVKLPVSDLESFANQDDLAAGPSSPTTFNELMSSDDFFSDPIFPMTMANFDDDMDLLSSSPFSLPIPNIQVTDHDAEAEAAAELAEVSSRDDDQTPDSDIFEGCSSDHDGDAAADVNEATACHEPLTPDSATFESFPSDHDLDDAPSESEYAVSEAAETSSDSDSDFEPEQPSRSARPSARQQVSANNGASRRQRSPNPVSQTSDQHEASTFGNHGHHDTSRAHSPTGGKSVSYTTKLLRNQPVTYTQSTGGKCTTALLKDLINDVLAEPLSADAKLARITRLVQEGEADADAESSSNVDSNDELDGTFVFTTQTRSTTSTPHARPSPRKTPSPSTTTTTSSNFTPGGSTNRFLTPPPTPATLRTPTGKAPQIRWQPDEVTLIRRELPKIVAAGTKGEERFARVADALNAAFGDRYVQQHGAGAGRTKSSVKNCVQRIVRAKDAAEGVDFDDRMPRKDGRKRDVVTSARANKKRGRNAREESDSDNDEVEPPVVKRQKRVTAGRAPKKIESDSENEFEEGGVVEAPASPSPRARSRRLGKKRSEVERMRARAVYMGEYL